MNICSYWATSFCVCVCVRPPLSVKQGIAHKQKRLYLNKKFIESTTNLIDVTECEMLDQSKESTFACSSFHWTTSGLCVRKFVFAWEVFSCGTHIMGGDVCVCVWLWLLCLEMTDERLALIFEQSALASLSVESMLFLRVREAEEKCVARVTPIAKKLQVGEYCRFRAPGISAVWLMSLWDLPGDRKENYSVHITQSGYCLVTTLNWILL